MKSLFLAIRQGDLEKVRALIEKNPHLVYARAKAPPKKDDGQSPLQVAFKSGRFDIADFLVLKGADVNFIEQSEINTWRAPVIHDAIRATVFSSRFQGIRGIYNSLEEFSRAFSSLANLIEHGASVASEDSYGNNCLMRACLDARQLQPDEHKNKLNEDLQKIFSLLISNGADIHAANDQCKSVAEEFKDEYVSRYFTKEKTF
jgi:ankyrin repeat protein